MNLDRAKSLDLVKTVKGRVRDGCDLEVAFFVPSIYLADVSAVAQGSPLGVGGQNMWHEDHGACTGELAPRMLREVGADRVLVGHSERRHMFREQEEWMALKLRAALNNDLQPVFCVGESFDDRKVSRTERFVKKQLESGFRLVKADDLHRITIAYEPVWAIGTGETATTKQVDDVHLVIRKWLHTKYGEEAETVRIIYGGSVSPDNAKQLMALDSVDGLLVGGASLQAETFLPIIEYGA